MTSVEFGRESYAKAIGVYQGRPYTSVQVGREADDIASGIVWARRIAPYGFAMAVLGGGLHRLGVIAVHEMLTVLGVAALVSLFAFALCLSGFFDIWKNGGKGLFKGLSAMTISMVTLAPYFLVMAALLYLPRVNGVTTTATDPPIMLSDLMYARTDPEMFRAQQLAYSSIQTQSFARPVQEIYQLAEALAKRQGLTITYAFSPVIPTVDAETAEAAVIPVPRQKPIILADGRILRRTVVERFTRVSEDGLFEAFATTPVLGFRDDILVRVTQGQEPGTSLVDIRSASRIGAHDLGTNARRIRAFQRELDLSVKATAVVAQ